jgi:hypothetical protein
MKNQRVVQVQKRSKKKEQDYDEVGQLAPK